MLQPPADVVLEDYVLMGEEYAKWMAQYSRASMKYYAENRPTMIADVQLQGISLGRRAYGTVAHPGCLSVDRSAAVDCPRGERQGQDGARGLQRDPAAHHGPGPADPDVKYGRIHACYTGLGGRLG
jgi:hypothetical protein